MAIHFLEEEVRPIGLVAAGVAGIKLAAGDQVVDAVALSGGEELLFLAGNGLAWRIKDSDFPMQGRNGQGIIVCRLAKGVHITGLLTGKKNQVGLVHFTKAAARQIRVDEVAMTKRAVKGQALCEIKEGDSIQKITPLLDGLAFWEQKKATPKAKRTAKVKKG